MRETAFGMLGAVGLLLAWGGCSQEPLTSTTSLDPDEEHALKIGAVARPAVNPVDWRAAARQPRLSVELSAALAARVRSSAVPVLLPDDANWLANLVFTSGQHWYAATMHVDGLIVTITGTRVAFHTPDSPPAQPTYPLEISHDRGIVSAAWGQHGVGYLVRVGCADPTSDLRCTGDEYARALVGRLVLAEVPR